MTRIRMKERPVREFAMLTTALLLALGGSSQAACRFGDARIYFGFESPMKGEADSGKPCGFALSAAGSAGGSAFRVAQPPRHGAAAIGEDNGMPVVAYRSAAGYRGPDEFVVTFVGGNSRTPDQPSSIRVTLDVK
jgi:hypothetical protein